jgi:CheY-like chemotaxis protein
MGQKRILVVDDEGVLRELLADILAREGHQVDTACDGLEALDWLDQHHYDAVFTDLTTMQSSPTSICRGWMGRACMQSFGTARVKTRRVSSL